MSMDSSKMELSLPPVSVIVPAYNEEAWIETTLSSLLTSGFPCEIIVVDDGSTDRTPEILQRFADQAIVITHPTNRGKGAAMASGIRRATGEIVVFCDAHLVGLNQMHLLSLVLPLVYGSARAVLGVAMPPKLSWTLTRTLSPSVILTGQRAYRREDLLPLVDDLEELGYGVETFLYTKFPRDKTVVVLLPGLIHLLKTDTGSAWQAATAYLREAQEIVGTLARIQGLTSRELADLRQKMAALLANLTFLGGEKTGDDRTAPRSAPPHCTEPDEN